MSLLCQIHEGLISQMSILILALVLDVAVGEPPEIIHPTVMIGKTAEWLSKRAGRFGSNKRVFGALYASLIVLLAAGSTFLLLEFARMRLGQPALIILGALILKTSFAIRSMNLHVKPIKDALEEGDLNRARVVLGKIVRRDTERLDEGLCASATIESIAEGTVDGVASPLFYFFLFGVPGAVAYRAINTLDSTVGYKTPTFMDMGWFSAKLDTAANYLPARITGIVMILAGAALGRNWRTSLSTMKTDRGLTESLNAGWPMSAMAGAVGVRLQKIGSYKLGNEFRQPTCRDITPALRIMWVTIVIFLVVAFGLYFAFSCLLLR
jgi:adenosylcobinamide-phosphate synthase